jgi:hypothetical protein
MKAADDKNRLYLELNSKDIEIRTLTEAIRNEREKSNDLADRLNEEITKQLEYLKEKEGLRSVGNVNQVIIQ